jgi:GNAT superfamily N-acetyltransferase
MNRVRKTQLADTARMVALSEQARAELEKYQPDFWRKAADSEEKQLPYFRQQIENERVIALVSEQVNELDGFIIGILTNPPPVYDPGGLTCVVDDFMVAAPDLWQSVGLNLLNEVISQAKERGAVQVVVICAHHDEPKRAMLIAENFPVASEWRVRRI